MVDGEGTQISFYGSLSLVTDLQTNDMYLTQYGSTPYFVRRVSGSALCPPGALMWFNCFRLESDPAKERKRERERERERKKESARKKERERKAGRNNKRMPLNGLLLVVLRPSRIACVGGRVFFSSLGYKCDGHQSVKRVPWSWSRCCFLLTCEPPMEMTSEFCEFFLCNHSFFFFPRVVHAVRLTVCL